MRAVDEDLARAEAYLHSYRPWDNRLLVTGILFGAIATVLAGGSAATGAAAVEAFGGWQPLCFCVAGLSMLATIAAALHKQLGITERLIEAEQCVAELRTLALMSTYSEAEQVAEQLAQVRQQYARVLA